MFPLRTLVLFLFLPSFLLAAEAKPNTLSKKEIEEGWILLFDGETTFGWKAGNSEKDLKPNVTIKEGELILAEKQTYLTLTSFFSRFELQFDFQNFGSKGAMANYLSESLDASKPLFGTALASVSEGKWGHYHLKCDSPTVRLSIKSDTAESSTDLVDGAAKSSRPLALNFKLGDEKDSKLIVRNIKLKPLGSKPIFNGKDLSGWKVFPGEKYKSRYVVTKEGWLNVKDGPGDIQTEAKYDDFVLQLECISNGKALNSGVFFRCIEGQYQNGYEMQIQNGIKDNDRTKPSDGGTGAIYRRMAARRVIPNDNEWFGMTLVAQGKHLTTWVNGIQVTDWIDDRPADDNPRKGARIEKGHLSIQGHDPTTDLNFRNLRIIETK